METLYKYSKYNIVIDESETSVTIYNTYSSQHTELSKADYAELVNNQSIDLGDYPVYLAQQGFIVPVALDETEKIQKEINDIQQNGISTRLQFVIAPTTLCNYKCKYCYESNINTAHSMDIDTEKKVIDFIKKKHQETPTDKIVLNWHGGEPLLCMDTIIRISTAIKEYCSEHKIVIKNYMFTNGYLLNDKNIELLSSIGEFDLIIPIDGTGELYENIKGTPDGAYKVLIDNLCKCHDTFNITINFNISESNADSIIDVINELKLKRKLNVYIRPMKIETYCTRSKYTYISDAEFTEVHRIFWNYISRNNIENEPFILNKHRVPCVSVDRNHYVIGPQGELYRCEHGIGNNQFSIGNIDDMHTTGDDTWIKYKLPEKCLKCAIMPICLGGCISNRELDDINANCTERIQQVINLHKNVLMVK